MSKSSKIEKSSGRNSERLRAVVDIGSNSVRLVVYDGPARAPIAICNEKALCGLGRALDDSGFLDPAAVAEAVATLARFRHLLKAFGDPQTHVIATAAVREAKNGSDFVKQVEKLGFELSVISGEEEAELAAMGVASVEPMAHGLAGDMGGGSLELVGLEEGAVKESTSLPIGPLSVMRSVGDDLGAARKLIERELAGVSFLKECPYDTLYAVGGAWRSIARIHMNLKRYPLSVLHHYELTTNSAVEVCDLVARQSRRSLEEIPGISKKRLETLPFAAIALAALLRQMKAKRIVVSSGGVREGVLYRQLKEKERRADPLIEACRFFSSRFSPHPDFGKAAAKVIQPLFKGDATVNARILSATAELCDIAAYSHPDMRGRHAFDTALSAPFVGVSHKERIWLALALFSRYRGRNAILPNEQAISLLDWDDQQSALRAGLALRFVATLAPKSPGLLVGCSLVRNSLGVVFTAPNSHQDLLGETPRKRLDALALAYEDAAHIEFVD